MTTPQLIIASDGRKFRSQREAAEELGVAKGTISQALNDKFRCKGVTLRVVGLAKVLQRSDGLTFNSREEAAKKTFVSPRTISRSLWLGKPTRDGYTWQWIDVEVETSESA